MVKKKKINTKKKAMIAHKAYKEIMIKQGWWARIASREAGNYSELDFFGVGDLMGIRRDELILVSVKHFTSDGELLRLKKWLTDNCDKLPDNLLVRLAIVTEITDDVPTKWRKYDIYYDRERGEVRIADKP